MSRGFRRVRRGGGAVTATFAPVEVALLRQLVNELVLLLRAETGSVSSAGPGPADDARPTEAALADSDDPRDPDALFAALVLDGVGDTEVVHPPDDDVVARLLPDAYRDDAEGAADFRRFTQDRLVSAKLSAAAAVLSALPDDLDRDDDSSTEVRLDPEGAQLWLRAVNDLRLALGTRLGVEQDDDETWEALADDDPRATVHEIYQWLGWVQETLVAALMK